MPTSSPSGVPPPLAGAHAAAPPRGRPLSPRGMQCLPLGAWNISPSWNTTRGRCPLGDVPSCPQRGQGAWNETGRNDISAGAGRGEEMQAPPRGASGPSGRWGRHAPRESRFCVRSPLGAPRPELVVMSPEILHMPIGIAMGDVQ